MMDFVFKMMNSSTGFVGNPERVESCVEAAASCVETAVTPVVSKNDEFCI